jgi:hypothetical protein
MEETSRTALEVLRSDQRISWIPDQLIASFSEGVACSAKEAGGEAQRNIVDLMKLSAREKIKREKYETTRPFDENEKLDLVKFALEQIFVSLPSMQNAAVSAFKNLGSTAVAIEFTSPDEERQAEGRHIQDLVEGVAPVADLKRRFEEFRQRLIP